MHLQLTGHLFSCNTSKLSIMGLEARHLDNLHGWLWREFGDWYRSMHQKRTITHTNDQHILRANRVAETWEVLCLSSSQQGWRYELRIYSHHTAGISLQSCLRWLLWGVQLPHHLYGIRKIYHFHCQGNQACGHWIFQSSANRTAIPTLSCKE